MTSLSSEHAPDHDAGLFGFSVPISEARLVIIPVPWEPTTSYGRGTAAAPKAIVLPSHQLDLSDEAFGEFYTAGITLVPESALLARANAEATRHAQNSRTGSDSAAASRDIVNRLSADMIETVQSESRKLLAQQKIVGVLGGDHSSPYGLIRALAEREPNFGILHIDAHFDLRKAYEGFVHSHASIMRNVLDTIPQVKTITHVGIRDYCQEELDYCQSSERNIMFTDHRLFSAKAQGIAFKTIADDIVNSLPEKVYISFDIDGLDPALCPGTGTPVPGGLSFHEARYLLERVVRSGRRVIGFDLCEVSGTNTEWDLNVGARILFALCGTALKN